MNSKQDVDPADINSFLFVWKISSLHSQIRSQETDLHSQEDELSRTKTDLNRVQEEEAQLEQRLLSGRTQLDSIIKSLKTTQDEISQVSSEGKATGYFRMLCHFRPPSSIVALLGLKIRLESGIKV